jgi:alanine racemase
MKIMGRKNSARHTRHSRIIIDLAAIRHNYRLLKQTAPVSRIVAVIKADAYGHGALEVAQALPNADAFAVATTLEALPLRAAGITQKIIILGGVIDGVEMQQCVEHQLDPVIHQFWQIELLAKVKSTKAIDVWLKFNSGMGRLGFSAEDLAQAFDKIKQLEAVDRLRLMTHLSDADDACDNKTLRQIEQVKSLQLDEYEWGIANSAGIVGWPKSRLNWVRAGIALYGSDPMIDHRWDKKLKPVMTFKAQLLAINELKAGQSIGYGSTYVCPQDQTIGVVSVGYADGYPRHLQQGRVIINGQSAPVVGRVSMDMITLDLSGVEARTGDEVTLWGADLLANEVAEHSETISYELFCHAGCHGQREFINK